MSAMQPTVKIFNHYLIDVVMEILAVIDNILMLMMENCGRFDAAESHPMSQKGTPHRIMAVLQLSALQYQSKWKMLDFLTLMSCHYASACGIPWT